MMNCGHWLKSAFLSGLLILLLLVGCQSGKGDPSLESSDWMLVGLGDQLPLPATTLTITFENGQAGGSAGCNSYGATYTIKGDQLNLDEITSTLMACMDNGVMEQEQVYLSFLAEVNTYAVIDGTLYLYRPDGSALRYIPQS